MSVTTMTSPKLNIVFLTGRASYPTGMAGAKRIQHAIDALKVREEVAIRVIIPRQSSKENPPCGNHNGIPYETVMPNLMRAKMAFWAPFFWLKAIKAIMRAWRPGWRNVIYKYGPPSIDDTFPVWYARRRGYQVVYDIVEDDDAAAQISSSFYHRIHNRFHRFATNRITKLADGIIVISSHLEAKFKNLTQKGISLHFRPISVNMDQFPQIVQTPHKPITLFYAGSFGVKDGVENIIDAFSILASSRADLRLILTGKGTLERMRVILDKIESSPFQDRIDYKEYLSDQEYYRTLNAIDIPCMTRIDSVYAHAGFPFKLGEFLASGKPVIASTVGNVGKLLTDRVDAILVKPNSVDDVVSAVCYLLDHPENARQIGIAGRQRAIQLFDHKVQGEKLYNFLQTLVSSPISKEN